MNPKPLFKFKLVVDVLMTLVLFFLMGYQLWGEAPHEWAGTAAFVLFIIHHVLNVSWHRALFKGKYTAARILILGIDGLLLLAMAAEMYSGIVMSRYVFDFLPAGGIRLARRLHILGAHWGFLLMSLHLGLHWNALLLMLRKAAGIKGNSKLRSAVEFLAGLLISAYGIRAFAARNFPVYLLSTAEFVFLDYSEPVLRFYLDYLAIMGLCVFVVHYGLKIMQRRKKHIP